MTVPLAASIVNLVLGLELGSLGEAMSNRCSLEGVTWDAKQGGAIEVGIQKLEAAALRLGMGHLVLEIGRITVHKLLAQVQEASGSLRLVAVEAAEAEVSGVKLHGPLMTMPQIKEAWAAFKALNATQLADIAVGRAITDVWCLGPLAAAEGKIRGEITDAHLLFDADVTVPIRHGQIDFNDATVEHVGPDSRMGVSRLGIYVDAPNGRSYVYQFASVPLAGVEFERRGALLSPWVSERGKLQLQPFVEALLRQPPAAPAQAVTQQTRQLLERTALSGDVQLSDGRFAVPGVQAHMEGRGEGRNTVTLHSEAVGRGLTVEMASLQARDTEASWAGVQLRSKTIDAGLKLQLFVEAAQIRFVLDVENCKLANPRLELRRSGVA